MAAMRGVKKVWGERGDDPGIQDKGSFKE